jgi:hypothetical protein
VGGNGEALKLEEKGDVVRGVAAVAPDCPGGGTDGRAVVAAAP